MPKAAGTENDVLVAALAWLHEEPPESRLSEAVFGRYADGSGCWWNLHFYREVHNGEVRDPRQDAAQKVLMVIQAWRGQLIQPPAEEVPSS